VAEGRIGHGKILQMKRGGCYTTTSVHRVIITTYNAVKLLED